MSGRPTFSPDLKFFSRVRPEIRDLYRVRTNAEPLPGLTCWNSTITNGSLSIRILSPLRNSLVSITSAIAHSRRPKPEGAPVYNKASEPARRCRPLRLQPLACLLRGKGNVHREATPVLARARK